MVVIVVGWRKYKYAISLAMQIKIDEGDSVRVAGELW